MGMNNADTTPVTLTLTPNHYGFRIGYCYADDCHGISGDVFHSDLDLAVSDVLASWGRRGRNVIRVMTRDAAGDLQVVWEA